MHVEIGLVFWAKYTLNIYRLTFFVISIFCYFVPFLKAWNFTFIRSFVNSIYSNVLRANYK